MKAVGRDSGPVRSPLTDLTESELQELSTLIEKVTGEQSARLLGSIAA
jgi:5-dehydro-4-deoxyglucarate dehydratase